MHDLQLAVEGREITASNVMSDSIIKVLMFIDGNLSGNIHIDMLCRHVYLSRTHLFRLFRKETGMSIIEYINTARIRIAKKFLKNTGLSVLEISQSLGYDDQFYFSRVFKKVEGISPCAYRKRFRK